MKKTKFLLRLLDNYAGNATAMFLICVVIFVCFALLLGSVSYIYREYSELKQADIDEGLYLSKNILPINQKRELLNSIENFDGVKSVISEPEKALFKDGDFGGFIYFVQQDVYEYFKIDCMWGKGFDYTKDNLECIIAIDRYKKYHIGDIFTVVYENELFEKPPEMINLSVSGIALENNVYPLFQSGGSKIYSDMIFSEVQAIFVKDTPAARRAFEEHMVNFGSVAASLIVVPNDNISDETYAELHRKMVSLGNVTTVNDILTNTRIQMISKIREVFPFLIFITCFLIINMICLVSISSLKTAKEYSLWYRLGADKKSILLYTTVSYSLILLGSALLSFLILQTLKISNSEFLTQILFNAQMFISILITVMICIFISFITVHTTLTGNNSNSLKNRYIE